MSTVIEAPLTPTKPLDPRNEPDDVQDDIGQAETSQASPETERQPESVIKMLIDRAEAGYRHGVSEPDGRKIALALDPGGYAGVVSLAMAKKLDTYFKEKYDIPLADLVDGVVGTSVGAFNGAYILSDQARDGIKVFLRRMPGRFVKQIPFADISVYEDAVYQEYPFDSAKLRASKTPLIAGVTKIKGREKVTVRSDEQPKSTILKSENVVLKGHKSDPFMDWLVAGGTLPILDRRSTFDNYGDQYADATLTWRTPLDIAAENEFTDVLSLSNLLPSKTEAEMSRAQRVGLKVANFIVGRVVDIYINNRNDGFRSDRFEYGDILKNKLQSEFRDPHFIYQGMNVERIFPANIEGLPRLVEGDINRMIKGVKAARLAIRDVLLKSTKPAAKEATAV